MRGPSSWNRRVSAVTANGYFTVLKSTGWFPTFRLPDGFRYLIRDNGVDRTPPVGAPIPPPESRPTNIEAGVRLRQIDEDSRGPRVWLRWALLALAACGFTFAMLRWMINP